MLRLHLRYDEAWWSVVLHTFSAKVFQQYSLVNYSDSS